MQRQRVLILVLSTALAFAIVGLVVLGRRSAAKADEADRNARRAFDAESRIRSACNAAAVQAMLTLRAFNVEGAQVGFALAMRDAGNTALCGGDADAIFGPVLRGDEDATFEAVLAQYDAWCPACAQDRQERLRERRERPDAGAAGATPDAGP